MALSAPMTARRARPRILVRVLQSLSGLSAPHFLSGPTASCSGVMMSEPTVDEIMEKAKQLCRLDGMLWSKSDFQNPMAQQIRTSARLAGEAVRRRYLKRAQTLLDTEARRQLPGR
jgi:hypothetical protein